MEETIWSAIAKEGLVPLVMAVFCYFTYRYFTKQNDKLYTRIEQKDEVITKMYS